MDNQLYTSSFIFIMLGIGGLWLVLFSGVAETLKGMEGVAVLILLIGLILLPGSVLRSGPPASGKHIFTAVLAVGFGIGALGFPYYLSSSQPPPPEPTGREVSIFLVADEWAFNDTNPTITVAVGDHVTVKVLNEGNVLHNFGVLELTRLKTEMIPAGEAESVTFTARKVGRFIYLCMVPGHKELGMGGEIIVEAAVAERGS